MRENDAAELARLNEPLRTRMAELLRRAQGAVWIESGVRSVQEQVDLRRSHCGPTWYDIWRKPASQCSPPTAVPGRSKHQTGEAVDVGGDKRLAARLAKALGLHFPVEGEDWHVEVDPSAQVSGLQGWQIPGTGIDVGIPNPFDDIGGAVEGAVGNVLGAVVEPVLEGGKRIVLVGVLLAGGVALVVLGGARSQQALTSSIIGGQ